MKLLLLFVTILIAKIGAVSFFELVQEEWKAFKLTHRKQYDSEVEERLRMKIYIENAHKVARHNQKYEMGLVSYKLKLNKFADMLHHEFIHTVNGFNRSRGLLTGQNLVNRYYDAPVFIPPANVELPTEVDWRNNGAVTPVKDQGQCGSCWSFSATGSLEGQHFRKYGKLISLSEQNLIDCSTRYGNNGCDGGLMNNAFEYVRDNHGLDTEKSYPYEAEDDKCRYNPKNSGADDKGYINIEQGNEDKLKAAVATVGPVSVAIDASHETFQFYSDGVYFEASCSSESLDHGVLVVGYGTDEEGGDYWLVKNSWGTSWGKDGYIKMARNKENNCGIASSASYPLV